MGGSIDSGAGERWTLRGATPESEQASGEADLPEFDEFLKRIGYGHLYGKLSRVEEEQAPPQRTGPVAAGLSSQPDAMPKTAQKPIPWRVRDRITAFAVAAIVMGAFGGPAVWGVLRGHAAPVAETAAQECEASPDFALERFHALRRGMTAEQLRNYLGLPLNRWTAQPGSDSVCWVYTVPRNGPRGELPLCTVTLQNGCVTGWSESKPIRVRGTRLLAMPCPVRSVGDLSVALSDGRAHTLRATDPAPSVLVGPWCGLNPTSAEVPAKSVFCLAAPKEDEQPALLVSNLAVYARGKLYMLPYTATQVPTDLLRDDLKWLLARLARGEA